METHDNDGWKEPCIRIHNFTTGQLVLTLLGIPFAGLPWKHHLNEKRKASSSSCSFYLFMNAVVKIWFRIQKIQRNWPKNFQDWITYTHSVYILEVWPQNSMQFISQSSNAFFSSYIYVLRNLRTYQEYSIITSLMMQSAHTHTHRAIASFTIHQLDKKCLELFVRWMAWCLAKNRNKLFIFSHL